MACDLKKNKDAMTDAFKDVLGDSDNDWVVFGYEKDNRTLKVVETGEDGYDEMVDELGETKAVYAIIKMKDPNSGLPKMMQINWLPDGLPAAVKAVVSRHVTDVERFFPGVHVRLNARYEEDIEEKVLLAKISKASGANYGVHKEKKKDYGPIAKTGTNYVKTDATKEVDVGQRNEYHRKTQEADERRRQEDIREKAAQQKKDDADRVAREKQESAARNEKVERKAQAVQAQRVEEEAERKRQEEEAKQQWLQQQQEEAERMTEAEQQAEIAKRDQWEQERERISGSKACTMAEEDRESAWQAEKERRWEEERESIRQQRAQACVDEEEDAEYQQEAEQSYQDQQQQQYQEEPQQCDQDEQQGYQEEQQSHQEEQQSHQEEQPEAGGSGVCCRVIYDYQAEDDTEVSLNPDEIVYDVEQNDENWWTGTNANGERGMFPANYVEMM